MKNYLLALAMCACMAVPACADAYTNRPSRTPFYSRAYVQSGGHFFQALGTWGRSGAFSPGYAPVLRGSMWHRLRR